MREIHDHKINPANDKLKIEAIDARSSGGANHHYVVSGYTPWMPIDCVGEQAQNFTEILFQNGPINVAGVNGITHEVLLAIVLDRLRCLNTGVYACRENSLAATKIEEALHWLQQRTLDRMRRGVEGTHKP